MIPSAVVRHPSFVVVYLLLLFTIYDLRFTAPSSALDLSKVETLMNTLEKKIEEAGGTKARSTRTMIGGVRAAQQKEEVKLYWRGKPKRSFPPAPPLPEDWAKARQILVLLKEKKSDQARAEIDAFAKAFPDSPYGTELKSISQEMSSESQGGPKTK